MRSRNAILKMLRSAEWPSLSDRELLRRFVEEGTEETFETIVCRYASLVQNVCQRMLRDEHEADDATQATFVVLARKAATIAWDESIAGWLHEVAVRVASEARRRMLRRRARERTGTVPEKAVEAPRDELSDIMDEELSRLPAHLRAPLVLCYLEGKTRDETAEDLGWTFSKVKSCLEKGRLLLRERLARRGVTLGAALVGALSAGPVSASAETVSQITGAAITSSPAAPVLELATTILKSMLVLKLTRIGIVVAVVCLAVATAGVVAQQALGTTTAPPTAPIPAEHGAIPVRSETPAPVPRVSIQHHGPVRGIALFPGGKHLVSASFDGDFAIWTVDDGKAIRRWQTRDRNSAVSVTPDGTRIAGGTASGELLIWDPVSGKEIAARLTRRDNVYAVAFAPDGRSVATANHDGSISIWNASTGANVRHVSAHKGRVWGLAFAPDGSVLASCGEDGLVCLWEPGTGKEIRKLTGHRHNVSSVTFSADGRKILTAEMEGTITSYQTFAGADDTIRAWNVSDGRQTLCLSARLTHVALFSPDGKLLFSGDRHGVIHVWDADTGKELCSWPGHRDAVLQLLAVDHRRLISSGQDGTIHVWELPKMP